MSVLQVFGGSGGFLFLILLIIFGLPLVLAYLTYRTGRVTDDEDAVLWAAVVAVVTYLGLTSGGGGVTSAFSVILSLLPGIIVFSAYAYVRQYDRP